MRSEPVTSAARSGQRHTVAFGYQFGDDRLSASLRSRGVAVSEEAVLDELVADLERDHVRPNQTAG